MMSSLLTADSVTEYNKNGRRAQSVKQETSEEVTLTCSRLCSLKAKHVSTQHVRQSGINLQCRLFKILRRSDRSRLLFLFLGELVLYGASAPKPSRDGMIRWCGRTCALVNSEVTSPELLLAH